MARKRESVQDAIQSAAADFANGVRDFAGNAATAAKEAPAAVYNMLRQKARDMGHAAADLPDDMWDKYVRMQYKHDVLKDAKLRIERYMVGEYSAVDFARHMAEDDALRYTVSDICRAKLEPAEIDIQHNGKYIDVGAGVKTFWSEIRVPLPSEIETARDLRNIYFGIEAARAAGNMPGQTASDEEPDQAADTQEEEKAPRVKFTDRLRMRLANAIMPKTEDETKTEESGSEKDVTEAKEPNLIEQFEASGLSHAEALAAYNNVMTTRAARNLENLVMTVEASKSEDLSEENRREAAKYAGILDEAINRGQEAPAADQDNSKKAAEQEEADTIDMPFAEEDVAADNDSKPESSSLPYKTDYTYEELTSGIDDDIAKMLDQIMMHVDRERYGQKPRQGKETNQPGKEAGQQEAPSEAKQPEPGKESSDAPFTRYEYNNKEYIRFYENGQKRSFKASYSTHQFSDEEVMKLIAGESVSFTYTNKSGKEVSVEGKVGWYNFGGKDRFGFCIDDSKARSAKNAPEVKEQPEAKAPEPGNDLDALAAAFEEAESNDPDRIPTAAELAAIEEDREPFDPEKEAREWAETQRALGIEDMPSMTNEDLEGIYENPSMGL